MMKILLGILMSVGVAFASPKDEQIKGVALALAITQDGEVIVAALTTIKGVPKPVIVTIPKNMIQQLKIELNDPNSNIRFESSPSEP